MYELLGIYIALFAGFAANFALLWQMKTEVSQIKMEFARCPIHQKNNVGGL